jgi:hypothetical protein
MCCTKRTSVITLIYSDQLLFFMSSKLNGVNIKQHNGTSLNVIKLTPTPQMIRVSWSVFPEKIQATLIFAHETF